MPVRSASKRVAPVAAMAFAMLPGTVIAGAAPMAFERAFPTTAAPAHFHARIAYRGRDGVHRIELWRDGATRLRRDTDARLITVATRRQPRGADFRLDLLDRRRRLHTIIDRTSLYQVGRFTDWNDLAFGMRRPAGRYRITALARVDTPVTAVAPCRWFALESEGRRTRICWSDEQAFPLLMLDDHGRPVWRVTALDRAVPTPALFHPDDTGYVRTDAAADIGGD